MRLAPDGPDGKGLSEPLAEVSTYSGEKAYTYRYYQAPNTKESAGIWASKSAHDGMHRATNTEVFYLNAGRVTLQDKSGREETFQAGDAVLLPRGAEFSWKRSEDVKEYFAVFDFDPTLRDTAAGSGETPTFVKLDPNKGLTAPSLGGHGYSYYSSPSGASVGVWETDWGRVEKVRPGDAHRTDGDYQRSRNAELAERQIGDLQGRRCRTCAAGSAIQMEQRKNPKVLCDLRLRTHGARVGSVVAAEVEAFGLRECFVIRRDRGLWCSQFSYPAGRGLSS